MEHTLQYEGKSVTPIALRSRERATFVIWHCISTAFTDGTRLTSYKEGDHERKLVTLVTLVTPSATLLLSSNIFADEEVALYKHIYQI